MSIRITGSVLSHVVGQVHGDLNSVRLNNEVLCFFNTDLPLHAAHWQRLLDVEHITRNKLMKDNGRRI